MCTVWPWQWDDGNKCIVEPLINSVEHHTILKEGFDSRCWCVPLIQTPVGTPPSPLWNTETPSWSPIVNSVSPIHVLTHLLITSKLVTSHILVQAIPRWFYICCIYVCENTFINIGKISRFGAWSISNRKFQLSSMFGIVYINSVLYVIICPLVKDIMFQNPW